jgi:ribose-phosphate pyrophosphokinase
MNNHSAALSVVANESDNPFAIDVAAHCGQEVDIADLLSLKTFANSEFCPRFISNEADLDNVGWSLRDGIVVIVSTGSIKHTRNELAWRNMLLARAAKDNGAKHVVLVEPDLFFSAQDRGPRPEHGEGDIPRDIVDRKKFDGQPFTSLLYGHVLALAGVDDVITVHNHSVGVQRLFSRDLRGRFLNLSPAELFAHYIKSSDVAPCLHNGTGLLICAPDKGARAFANEVHEHLQATGAQLLYIAKQRMGERDVSSFIDPSSPASPEDISGKDVIVFDDMVRTGGTIRECCRLLKEAGANRTVFFVTHFQSSPEVRENLHTPELDEIVTTNTIPCILNRDMQGRLRKKMTVLKIEKWLSYYTLDHLGLLNTHPSPPLYAIDMSSKNPRWKQR